MDNDTGDDEYDEDDEYEQMALPFIDIDDFDWEYSEWCYNAEDCLNTAYIINTLAVDIAQKPFSELRKTPDTHRDYKIEAETSMIDHIVDRIGVIQQEILKGCFLSVKDDNYIIDIKDRQFLIERLNDICCGIRHVKIILRDEVQ